MATTLGIPALVVEGTDTPAALTGATGIPLTRLAPLLDALEALELVARHDDRLRLTALGEVLLEESAQDSLDLADPLNRLELSLLGLVDTLRTGRPARYDGPDRALATWRAEDPAVAARVHDAAERTLLYNLPPLVAVPAPHDAPAVTVIGDGIVPTAVALARDRPGRRITLRIPAADEEETRRRLTEVPPAQRQALDVEVSDDATTVPETTTPLVQLALDAADDEQYARLVGRGARTLVIVAALADGARTDDHLAADALTALASTGVPLRTGARHTELLHGLGLHEIRVAPLGWGFGPSLILGTA